MAIVNTISHTIVSGTNDNDYIRNFADNVSINALGGKDYIYNERGSIISVDGGAGDDTINIFDADKSTINGDNGNDKIEIHGKGHILDGGAGNDYISNFSTNSTVNGGAGDDTINNDNDRVMVLYTFGDGNDVIYGFKANSTLSISGGVHSESVKSGNNIILTVGGGKVTLKGAAKLSQLNIIETPVNVNNSKSNTVIEATNANDTITNSGDKVTILTYDGNDSISNRGASVSIDGGAGNDTIFNAWCNEVSISGGAGNDSVENHGSKVTIDGGAGHDSIFNRNEGDNSSVSGGAGNDFIYETGDNVTISGGTGDDSIYLNWDFSNNRPYADDDGSNVIFEYVAGDGNDVIYNFKADSTLSINGGVYATSTKSGDDVIVTVGEGKVSLIGAAKLSAVNIIETPVNINNHDSNKTVFGINADDTITNTAENVTIQALRGKDSINNSAANVSIDGGEDNDRIINTGKNVTIAPQSGNDTVQNNGDSALISGGAGDDSIFSEGNFVTIISGNGNDTVQNNGDSALIAGDAGKDSINNSGDNVTIDGGADNDSILSKGTANSVSAADGNDLISLQSSYKNTISGGKGNDTIKLDRNSNAALIQYNMGDGDDVIEGFNSTSTLRLGDGDNTYSWSVNGDDLIITPEDGGKITLTGAATLAKVNVDAVTNINIVNTDNEVLILGNRLEDSIVNRGNTVTIKTFAGRDTISNYSRYVTIDAGADVDYIANNNANFSSINAGGGNDLIDSKNGYKNTILGGTGDDDIFISSSEAALIQYNPGDGNDFITDFNETSTLQIGDGTASYYKGTVDDDVIITVNKYKVTLKGAATLPTVNIFGEEEFEGKDERNRDDNTVVSGTDGNDKIRNYGSTVTILANGGNDSIYNTGSEVTIDGGKGHDSISNENDNVSIAGGVGNDLIQLGMRNEELGIGSNNVLIQYNSGDGNDTIYGFRADSTLSISGGLYSLQTSGNDAIVTVDDGKISLIGAATLSTVNVIGVKDKFASKITNADDDILIAGGNANDTISNSGSRVTILAYGGSDNITNNGANAFIDAGKGDDEISNANAKYATIDGGDGNDTIENGKTTYRSSLNGGAGDDYLYDRVGSYVTLNGGAGADTIYSYGYDNVIIGGSGDDSIFLRSGSKNERIIYNTGDGNDTIDGFRADSTLQIGDGTETYSSEKIGNDLIVTVGEGKITLTGAATLSNPNIIGDKKESALDIKNTTDEASVTGTSGNDTITNSGEAVTINALGGNDLITNNGGGDETSIDAGAGDDTISNNHAQEVAIAAGNGNDEIFNSGNESTLDGGAGNDTITNDTGFFVSISGAAGDDLINITEGFDVTVNGGKGSDTVKIDSDSTVLIEYNAGDGNDLIAGFNEDSTLQISGSAHSTAKSGDDVIVTVGKNKITLAGAANLSNLNIDSDGGEIEGKDSTVDAKIFVASDNSKLDASDERGNLILIGANNSTILGGKDTNKIYLAEDGKSTVLLNGRNTIENFSATFAGDKISVDAASYGFSFDGENLSVKSGDARALLKNISSDGGGARILTLIDAKKTKVAVAQENLIISAGDELADIYYGKKSGVDFTACTKTLNLDMDGDDGIIFYGINSVIAGSGLTTLVGTNGEDTLVAGNGRASIWSNWGDDLMIGNTSADKNGSTEFFFLAGDGRDIISNFEFLTAENFSTADKINVGNSAVTDVRVNSSGDVIMQLDDGNDHLTLEDAQGKKFRINNFVATVDKKSLTYDAQANFYVATGNNATLLVNEAAEVWLDESHDKFFAGDFKVLDASNSDGENVLAGNDLDNTILGGQSNNSLWGGNGGDDLLIGGAGKNTFFCGTGEGNDTVQNANDGDNVILYDVTLDQISDAKISADAVEINFMDGGSLTVNGTADVTYQLADGSKFSANREQGVWL